ncbi:unnamed protein product, partial [Gulo gulo]
TAICPKRRSLWKSTDETSNAVLSPRLLPSAHLQPAVNTLNLSSAGPPEKENLPWSPAAACMTKGTLYWLQKDGREETLI